MTYAVSVSDEATNLLGAVFAVAVKVLIFLLIMGIGWFVAAWLRTWLTRVLARTRLDRAVQRGGLGRVLGTHPASDVAGRLAFFAIVLFVAQLAFGIFGPNPVSALLTSLIAWLPRLFVAIVIVVVAAAVAGWVHDAIVAAMAGVSYRRTVATTAQVLIVALGVIAAVNQIGVAVSVTLPVLITVLATVGGILVVGLGGGLIKPMQHRWERMLNRAETETTLASEKVRANRAAERDANATREFTQPAYGRHEDTTRDLKPGQPPPALTTPNPTSSETGRHG